MTYFPDGKRTFVVACIYRGSRDGWSKEIFNARVWGQGANLILVKTKQGAIIGGFTTKSWGPGSAYVVDDAAFIFNMNQRFN